MPQRLASRGYMVLAYDFRGNGGSARLADTDKLDVDLHAAIAFVLQQGATKIVLLGSSMGGMGPLKVAASEQVGSGVSDAEVKAISAPTLFINSQNDDYASDTQHMFDIANQPKEIHLFDGSAYRTMSHTSLCI